MTDRTRPRRPRDSQRQRCYDAEHSVDADLHGRSLDTLGDLREWFAKALAGEPGAPDVTVGSGSGSRRARATWSPERGHKLQFPRAMRTEIVACHELAHVLVTHRLGFEGAAAHGWQWAATYLDLVSRHVSPQAGARLEEAFVAFRVRYRPPPATARRSDPRDAAGAPLLERVPPRRPRRAARRPRRRT